MSESARNEKIHQFELFSLEPGSWIGGNFNIWIGHPEKNHAWELIYRTREDYEKIKPALDEEQRKRILKEFLIAESSDWFWWYGDDHHTVQKETFDALFRKHLINIYHIMELPPPHRLFTPIVTAPKEQKPLFLKEPLSQISPAIDGEITTFFEWLGAGEMDLLHELSAMNMQEFLIEKLYFGWDEAYAYFALKGEIGKLLEKAHIELHLSKKTLRFDIRKEETKTQEGIVCQSGTIFELRLPKTLVWEERLSFRLLYKGEIAQQIPLYSKLSLKENDHLAKQWFI